MLDELLDQMTSWQPYWLYESAPFIYVAAGLWLPVALARSKDESTLNALLWNKSRECEHEIIDAEHRELLNDCHVLVAAANGSRPDACAMIGAAYLPAGAANGLNHAQESNMELISRLQWRYATKKMDPAKLVPQDKVERILEAARLAPTSSGLQPYEIIVITNPALRAQIKPIAFDQTQITDCSHLLVFAAWDDYSAERINMMFDLTNAVRGGTNEGWENYRNMLLNSYPPRGADVNFQHAARQAYIGLGAALIAAACEDVDSTPMEGFDPNALDELLGLRARGLRSVALMPLGYRDQAQDWLVNLPKVRRPRDKFVSEVK